MNKCGSRGLRTLIRRIQLFSCVSPALAGTNVTDEQLDEMLESGQTDVFTQNVSTHTAKGGR